MATVMRDGEATTAWNLPRKQEKPCPSGVTQHKAQHHHGAVHISVTTCCSQPDLNRGNTRPPILWPPLTGPAAGPTSRQERNAPSLDDTNTGKRRSGKQGGEEMPSCSDRFPLLPASVTGWYDAAAAALVAGLRAGGKHEGERRRNRRELLSVGWWGAVGKCRHALRVTVGSVFSLGCWLVTQTVQSGGDG